MLYLKAARQLLVKSVRHCSAARGEVDSEGIRGGASHVDVGTIACAQTKYQWQCKNQTLVPVHISACVCAQTKHQWQCTNQTSVPVHKPNISRSHEAVPMNKPIQQVSLSSPPN